MANIKKYALWIHAAIVIAVYAVYYSFSAHNFPKYLEYAFFALLMVYATAAAVCLARYFKVRENHHVVNAWYFLMVFMLILLVVD